jgi:hypothetical protein
MGRLPEPDKNRLFFLDPPVFRRKMARKIWCHQEAVDETKRIFKRSTIGSNRFADLPG